MVTIGPYVLGISLIVGAVNYVLVDLYILPKAGAIGVALLDGLMAAFVFYLFDFIMADFNITLITLSIFGILIVIGEYFFHGYLLTEDKVAPSP